MFRVGDTILSEKIATAKFACDVARCKGACCVVGVSGAPVAAGELPILNRAYEELRDELRPEAVESVEDDGLIRDGGRSGYEIGCTDGGECVFVDYNESGVAECVIQRAYQRGEFSWEKPVSCHLYPVRLKRIAGLEFADFEYIPDLCSAGCENGSAKGIYLSRFLEKVLVRRFGDDWYREFEEKCNEIRNK